MTKSKIKTLEQLEQDNQYLKDQLKLINRKTNLDRYKPYKIKDFTSLNEQCAVIAQFSDAHVDEIVDKRTINGLNEYNPIVAEQRVAFFFKRLLYLIRSYRQGGRIINHLILHLGGDLISGYIKPELEETNSMSPVEAIIFIQELLAKGIYTLCSDGEFDEITVVCTPGNHARTTEKKRFKSGIDNNYETILYHNLSQIFSRPETSNVKFITSTSEFIYLDVFGYTCAFSHGDHFKYAGGIGGIEVPLRRWLVNEQNIVPFHMRFIGHWHEHGIGNNCTRNGSVIGYSEYARSLSFKPGPPIQMLTILDSKRGFTLREPIILTDF